MYRDLNVIDWEGFALQANNGQADAKLPASGKRVEVAQAIRCEPDNVMND